jgi:hypothetical protein
MGNGLLSGSGRLENSKLIMYGLIALALLASVFVLFKLKGSSEWNSTSGVILKSEIETVYRSPLQQGAGGDRTVDYRLVILYRYQVEGKEYSGSSVMAGLPNIAGSKIDGEALVKSYPVGKEIIVFYNPKSPADAALITGNSIPMVGYILIFSMIIGIGALIIFVIRRMP